MTAGGALALLMLSTFAVADDALHYGGYDLQSGDSDTASRYGGQVRSAAGGDVLPSPDNGFIRQLQRDLKTLGFALVGEPDGTFGRHTAWAVREFQIYAKMPKLAQEAPTGPGASGEYLDRLSALVNPKLYDGPISGVVNADTRKALQLWTLSRLRCPVVINAWSLSGGAPDTIVTPNLWLNDDLIQPAPRVYARDFSGYYNFPASHGASDPIVLGDYQQLGDFDGPHSQPPKHTWPEAEVLPETLVGVGTGALSAAQKSTFKVVRAVAEQECLGFFDSMNAYDNAVLSAGLFHWVLGLTSGNRTVSGGELPAYLAYLGTVDGAAALKAFEFFGIRPDKEWGESGAAMAQPNRTYLSWVRQQCEDGTYRGVPKVADDADYFRGWHWFYRFAMAGRTVEGFRRRMWHMARIRFRDVLSTPWGEGVADVSSGTSTRPATIGDVFTSEQAVGIILRWHVNRPSHVVEGNSAGEHLRNAFARASVGSTSPTDWGDDQEATLISGLVAQADASGVDRLKEQVIQVRDWPTWAQGANPRRYRLATSIGGLSKMRHSFVLDGADLPPRPGDS